LGILLPLLSASIGNIKASQAKKHFITGFESINKQICGSNPKHLLKSFAWKDFQQEQGL